MLIRIIVFFRLRKFSGFRTRFGCTNKLWQIRFACNWLPKIVVYGWASSPLDDGQLGAQASADETRRRDRRIWKLNMIERLMENYESQRLLYSESEFAFSPAKSALTITSIRFKHRDLSNGGDPWNNLTDDPTFSLIMPVRAVMSNWTFDFTKFPYNS